MKNFDVQSIELLVSLQQAFEFIADPTQLPVWTHAFASVEDEQALMRTPQGELSVGLQVQSSAEHGTIDWHMSFPDGTASSAFSRLVQADPQRCVYSFMLLPPPVPLEQLEGALAVQAQILREELIQLKNTLEHNG